MWVCPFCNFENEDETTDTCSNCGKKIKGPLSFEEFTEEIQKGLVDKIIKSIFVDEDEEDEV